MSALPVHAELYGRKNTIGEQGFVKGAIVTAKAVPRQPATALRWNITVLALRAGQLAALCISVQRCDNSRMVGNSEINPRTEHGTH